MTWFPFMPSYRTYDDYEDPGAPITIGVPEPLPDDREIPDGVRVSVLRNFDADVDVTVHDGIPVTTVERTLVDLADEMSPRDVADMIERASELDMFDPEQFVATLERVDHPRGKPVARAALAMWIARGCPGARG